MNSRLIDTILSALPTDLANDLRDNVSAAVRSGLDKANLVTREELTVQEKVLARTREKVVALEAKVKLLEEQVRN
ncbi:MAG: accessory factor UbiK family protein [Arenicellales bacterium WSBS_2016_MAG_OTU3]